MRWQRLFEDFEAQLAAAEAAERSGEIGERTRAERAEVELVDRLLACMGQPLTLTLVGGERVEGRLLEAAAQWLLVTTARAQTPAIPAVVLIPVGALSGVLGLGVGAATSGRSSLARQLSLRSVLRAVARDRSPVRIALVDGVTVSGTIDAVGADHLDLAEHSGDQARRAHVVRGVRTVPLAALASVRPASGTTSLGG